MECELLKTCPFYTDKMPIDHGLGALYKKRYCEGGKDKCARYLVFSKLGREHVPVDMYPNMWERAQAIIKAADRSKA